MPNDAAISELAALVQRAHTLGTVGELLELVRRVTGEELSPRHLVGYLRERYGKLYLD